MDKIVETIKSYLIGLGFQVEQEEFTQATRTINELGKTIQTSTAAMAKNFTVASTAITAALVGVTAGVTGLITEVAKADLEYTKFANKMWTSKAAAKEMKMSMDALGESIEDIAFTPELRQQYGELIALGRQMNTPTDASEQLKNIRSIMFEFKKLKLEVAYAMEWVAYYLGKYLGGPLTDIKKQLSDLNMNLTQTMPEWTKKVAQVLAMIMNVGMAGIRFFKDLYTGIERVFDSLPKGIQKATVAILGAWALLRMSPIGLIMTAITAVLILLEDFYGYLDGRESSKTLAPIWQKLIDWFNDASNLITITKKDIQDLWDTISDSSIVKSSLKLINSYFAFLKEVISVILTILFGILDIFADIFNELLDSGALAMVVQLFSDLLTTIADLLLGIVNLSKEMRKFWREAMGTATAKKVWQWFKDIISFNVKMVATLGRSIIGIVDVVALAMQGKFTEAAARGKRILSDFTNGMTSAIKGERAGNAGGLKGFMEAIGQKESGGNYDSPAHMDEGHWNLGGKYQILASNWANWAKDSGLSEDSPYTAENQEIVASHIMSNLYQKHGRWDLVAAEWNGGAGGAESYRRYGQNSYEHGYVSDVMGNFNDSKPSNESRYAIGQNLNNAQSNYSMFNQNLASSYQPQPSSSSYLSQSTFGDININIAGTNATTEQITKSVSDGITQAQERQTARNMREFGGVYS